MMEEEKKNYLKTRFQVSIKKESVDNVNGETERGKEKRR